MKLRKLFDLIILTDLVVMMNMLFTAIGRKHELFLFFAVLYIILMIASVILYILIIINE